MRTVRGELYLKKKMYKEAIDDFTVVVAKHPTDAGIIYKRGKVYERMNLIEEVR